MLTDTKKSLQAKVHPVDGMAVEWTNGLWKERFDTCANSTIPQLQNMFEDKDISHVLENFRICAGEADGSFDGTVFGDGDFYKWMEAALYTASKTKNTQMLDQIDIYIELIGKAQLEDGYISTKQIIGEREDNGVSRLGDINDFEVYNFGHLFTTACLHKRLTGKDNFLTIAVKTADYLEKMYEDGIKKGEVQTAVCPSHYMGLTEMYRTTGEERYLKLAKQAISLRDSVKEGLDDNQDKIPLKEHEKIIGHAVRANYLYAGVADLCLEEKNEELQQVLDKVWDSLVNKKLYLTGGCGALYNGTSPYGNFFVDQKVHQAYGYEYQLPNITAYNETCATVGGVLWAYRMFQLDPRAEYFDIIERMMLNTNLAALSLDGKKFFYENMLRRTKKLDYELVWPLTRTEYIFSYCCPPNVARTIAQSSEYAYTVSGDTLWLGMYGANKAKIKLENGAEFTLVQETKYPYDGAIRFTIEDVQSSAGFCLNLRIPGWLENGYIRNGEEEIILTKDQAGSYYTMKIEKPEGAQLDVFFDMPVRYTAANSMVEETEGQVALECGPLVYCCEAADTKVDTLDDIRIDLYGNVKKSDIQIQGREVGVLEIAEYCLNRNGFDRGALYQNFNYQGMSRTTVKFIPYFAWDNRDFGEMRIWFPAVLGNQNEKIEKPYIGNKKIVVLDDDPTGVQTVHGVSVYTDWETDSLRRAFAEEGNMFFILTNSRSFTSEVTERVHADIARRILAVSKEYNKEFILISRSDSTLRGHYPLETEVLKDTLEREENLTIDGEIICPFFREGNRITIDNVHYIKEDNMLIPAGKSEFAKDKTFGFISSDLTAYVEEKTKGRFKKEDCITISLEELEMENVYKIKEKLLQAEGFQKIIVNAVYEKQLKVFCIAFAEAVQSGKHFLARTAAGFPKVLGNISDRPLLTKKELVSDSSIGGVVIVGSHVNKTTMQLEELRHADRPLKFMEFDVQKGLIEKGLTEEADRITCLTEECILSGKTAVIYTSRKLLTPDNMDKEKLLELSVSISDAVTSIIGKLKTKPGFIVAKGGITSSDVGTKALQVKRADVMGQIRKGIPVWMTGKESKFPGMPYIIFPGNVGEKETLKNIVEELI